MFNAQSLLGGLLKEITSGNTLGNTLGTNLGSKSALGMGALGMAIAAFEHFTEAKTTTKNFDSSSQNTGLRSETPLQRAPLVSAPPPPPPSALLTTAPPPMPASAISNNNESSQQSALLLIDAMLAAANADGYIDADEKSKIFQQLEKINSDKEGFDYVQQRIDNPPSLDEICRKAQQEEIAKQVYMVSLLAITIDTEKEADYIKNLASCLPIDAQTIAQLNEQFQTKE